MMSKFGRGCLNDWDHAIELTRTKIKYSLRAVGPTRYLLTSRLASHILSIGHLAIYFKFIT